jgi:Flp pilus assembly pilin Flp
MKTTFNTISDRMYQLAKGDRGAEGLEKLLIVAAIVLPLLGVLLFFKGAITDWLKENWESIKGHEEGKVEDPSL